MNGSLAIAVANNGKTLLDGRSPQEELETLLETMLAAEALPVTMLFYTEGVRWVVKDSPVLTKLQAIEAKGANVISCLDCLSACNLTNEVGVGTISDEETIMETLWAAGNVMVI